MPKLQLPESWKPINGSDDRYEVSDRGRVRSVDRKVNAWFGPRTVPGRILQTVETSYGYLVVTIGKRQQRVHRLVLDAFIGPCPKGCVARHLDGDKSNNELQNLKWGTGIENEADKARHGRTARGQKNGNSKLQEFQIKFIRESSESSGRLARRFRVHRTLIWQIRRGIIWAHKCG